MGVQLAGMVLFPAYKAGAIILASLAFDWWFCVALGRWD